MSAFNNTKKKLFTLKEKFDMDVRILFEEYEELCAEGGFPLNDKLRKLFTRFFSSDEALYLTAVYKNFHVLRKMEPCKYPANFNAICEQYPFFKPELHTYFKFYVYASEEDHDKNRPYLYNFISPVMLDVGSSDTHMMYKCHFVHASIACIRMSVNSALDDFDEKTYFDPRKEVNIAFFSKLLERSIGIPETNSRRWYNVSTIAVVGAQETQVVPFRDCSSQDRFKRLKIAVARPVRLGWISFEVFISMFVKMSNFSLYLSVHSCVCFTTIVFTSPFPSPTHSSVMPTSPFCRMIFHPQSMVTIGCSALYRPKSKINSMRERWVKK